MPALLAPFVEICFPSHHQAAHESYVHFRRIRILLQDVPKHLSPKEPSADKQGTKPRGVLAEGKRATLVPLVGNVLTGDSLATLICILSRSLS